MDHKQVELFKMLVRAANTGKLVLVNANLKDGTPCPVLAVRMGATREDAPNAMVPIGNLAWKDAEDLYEISQTERHECVMCKPDIGPIPKGSEILGHMEMRGRAPNENYEGESEDFVAHGV